MPDYNRAKEKVKSNYRGHRKRKNLTAETARVGSSRQGSGLSTRRRVDSTETAEILELEKLGFEYYLGFGAWNSVFL